MQEQSPAAFSAAALDAAFREEMYRVIDETIKEWKSANPNEPQS